MRECKNKFIFIAGPCVIENRRKAYDIAAYLKDLTARYPLLFIFKASFDKANRTSLKSFRGPGLSSGIKILENIKKRLNVPVLSDIHCRHQIKYVKDVLDVIQIPAFLCRQTDLIVEAAKTKKIINIKKGQFLAPYDVKYIIEKVEACKNKNIFITERGASFGYNNLVVDFRSFPIMKKMGYPVIFDVTHSLQKPSVAGGISGGDSEFVDSLSLAGTACGIDGLFMEVHPDPKKALSDKHTSYDMYKLNSLILKLTKIRKVLDGQI
ncbi:MAG: 3-deoxy-8-phosphooctulonate synthase [Candidatus Omnitrophica bacterium]|nr:3-deoxy-8-phosphooctulonate synthase [Candidatus Omnitrophota bacterium]